MSGHFSVREGSPQWLSDKLESASHARDEWGRVAELRYRHIADLESQLAAEKARADALDAMLGQAYRDNIRTAGVYAYSDWLSDLARRTGGDA